MVSCSLERKVCCLGKNLEGLVEGEYLIDVEKTLKAFVEENFLARRDKTELSYDESLLDGGLVDSAGIFELVGFVENKFGIQVEDTDIVPEKFESINSLANFVRSKQGRRQI